MHTAETDVLNLAHRYRDRTVPSSYKMVMSDSLVLYDLMKYSFQVKCQVEFETHLQRQFG